MRRFILTTLALSTLGALACSSPSVTRHVAADGERERGLADLRKKLALGAPSGRVVGGADGQWLVHAESGKRLLRLPAGDWEGKPVSGITLLFEGTPGVALVFDHQDVGLARFDRATGKAVWTPVLVPTLPSETSALLAYERAFGEEVAEVDAAPVEARVEVAGRAPVVVSLDLQGLAIRQGDELLFDRPQSRVGTYCSGKHDASLRSTKRPDGTVLLRYESVTTWAGDGQTCNPDYKPVGTDKDLAWIEIGTHGEVPRVVWSDWSTDAEDPYTLSDGHSRIVETAAGTFEYQGTNQGEGGWTEDSWSWKLTPLQGEPITLIDVVP